MLITPLTVNENPLIPLSDYRRIFHVIYSVLEGVEANSPRACIFFSVAGAEILKRFYKKDACPVAGAAFYRVDDAKNTILSLAEIHDNQATSTIKAFHCWVVSQGYAIDFMAPIFEESLVSSGHKIHCPKRMFQKKLSTMSESFDSLQLEGDFFLAPNIELTEHLLTSFANKPTSSDLLKICMHWFKRPPKKIRSEQSIKDDLGKTTVIKLSDLSISGVW